MDSVYKLSVTGSFSAAHRLEGYPGACRELHGHNWKVRASLRADALDGIGLALDFGVIRQHLQGVLAEFDHTLLNDHPAFAGLNPSSENLARYIFERLEATLAGSAAKVLEVEVCESENSSVVYSHA